MNRKFWTGSFVALSAMLVMGIAQATMPGEVVADFKLTDHTGKTRSLYEGDSTKPIVLMIQGNYCPIVRHAMPALKEVSDKYAPQGVRFLLLNSNIQDNQQTIAKEVEEFGYPFPVLVDQGQRVGEALYVQRTSEVFVIDPKTKKLLYRGPLVEVTQFSETIPLAIHEVVKGDARTCPAAVGVESVSSTIGALLSARERRVIGLPIDPQSHYGQERWPIS